MEEHKWITIIGCGPGSAEYLTPAARKACMAADAAVGSPRTLALFPEFRGERIVMEGELQSLLDRVAAMGKEKKVAVLVTGDSGLFSLGASFIQKFGRDACHIVPGISSVQAAFASVGLDWAGAEILSAHHGKPRVEIRDLERKDKIALLAGSKASMSWISTLCEGLRGAYDILVCEDLTLETETVRSLNASSLRSGNFSSRTVVLLIRSGLLR